MIHRGLAYLKLCWNTPLGHKKYTNRYQTRLIYLHLNNMKTEIKNIVWKEENHYVAQCLNVEVSSFGETKQEALKNLQEAVELYFEDAPFEELANIEEPEIIYSVIEHA